MKSIISSSLSSSASSLMLVCLLFVCITMAEPSDLSIGFTGNITGGVDENLDWEYRFTNIASWDLTGLIGCGAWFNSLSVSGSTSSFGADSIWGAASVVTGGWPIAWFGYWDASISFGDTPNWFEISVDGAAGYLASSYVSLIEKDPSGVIVNSQSLEQGLLPGTLGYDLTNGANAEGTLKWVTMTGSSTSQPWTIALTFLMSDVLGVVNYGDAIVGPKSVESVVEIKNWPYASPQNTLSLVMGVATGNMTAHAGTKVTSGSGRNEVYFALAEHAVVGGKKEAVSISDFLAGDFDTYFDDGAISLQLSAAFLGQNSVRAVEVTFPAGAKDIVYDPSVGVGQQPTNKNAATTAAVSSILLMGMFAALLF